MIPSTIRFGSRSTAVARWQAIVGVVADGVFGRKTETATKVWQAAHGLTPDGVVGAMSWTMALAKEPTPIKPATHDRVHGVDVSYVQRNAVDWAKVKAAGFEFAFVKSTEGNTGKDPTFDAHVSGAKKAGLYVGAYHFARPSADDQDAARELENMYAATKGLGSFAGELPPVLDLESTKLAGPATFKWVETWVYLAEKYWGRWPVLYTGSYFWAALGKEAAKADWLRQCPLWIAQYNLDPAKNPAAARAYEPPPGSGPRVPAPWANWNLWQYSGTGGKRVPGVSVDCDRNVFRGSLADFREQLVLAAPDAA